MKDMKKQICSLFLALLLASSSLAALGANPSAAPSDSPSESGEISASPSPSGSEASSASPSESPSVSASSQPDESGSEASDGKNDDAASSQEPADSSPSPSPSATPTPTPQPDDVSPEEMKVQAKAAILVDVSTDTPEILFEQNARDQMYPASITKVMTALLVMEAIESGTLSLDQVVSGSEAITSDLKEDGSTQHIQPGEEMTVENLLYCMLVSSANEACNILAEAVDGSLSAFHDHMNQRAKELGCENTHFVNAHGLPSTEHYTTAYDIFLMCQEAMKYPAFQTICSTKSYTVPATNLSEERHLFTTNYLLSNQRVSGYYYAYATGIKTGSTDQAGYCLASSATKNSRTVISVVLGAENIEQENGKLIRNSFAESRRLLMWGLNNFQWKELIDPTTPVKELTVRLSSQIDYVTLKPDGTLKAILPKNVDVSQFEQTIDIPEETVEAPITEGQVLGTLTLSYNGKDYGTLNLVAVSSISRSQWLFVLDRIQKFFRNPFVKLLIVVLIIFFIVHTVRKRMGLTKKKSPSKQSKRYQGKRRK
jgi:D-alanyl-D-alanine carboxypeptidase (penicillin-binding protein 5/6)